MGLPSRLDCAPFILSLPDVKPPWTFPIRPWAGCESTTGRLSASVTQGPAKPATLTGDRLKSGSVLRPRATALDIASGFHCR